MALITTLADITQGIVDIFKTYKEDLELDESNIFIQRVPQEFAFPALLVQLVSANLVRANPDQGRWELVYRIEYAYQLFAEPDREEKLLKVLGSLMVYALKNPTLGGASFSTEAESGETDLYLSPGKNQGVEGVVFNIPVLEEPEDISYVL